MDDDIYVAAIIDGIAPRRVARGNGWEIRQLLECVYEFILDWDAEPHATWEASVYFFENQLDVEVVGTREADERWITTILTSE